MKYITHHQGRWDPSMATPASPIDFTPPNDGEVLVLAQASIVPNGGVDTVEVKFSVWDNGGALVVEQKNGIRLADPNHGVVPVTYLRLPVTTAKAPYRVGIEPAPGTPGVITPDDFFSVSVVELEHALQLE